jgi:hypothetical protein
LKFIGQGKTSMAEQYVHVEDASLINVQQEILHGDTVIRVVVVASDQNGVSHARFTVAGGGIAVINRNDAAENTERFSVMLAHAASPVWVVDDVSRFATYGEAREQAFQDLIRRIQTSR